jgi:hypothetical protein
MMGADTQLKDCPSCGSSIPEAAVRCTVCNSGLGHCVGCNAWIVVGTECFDCGKTTAVVARKAVQAARAPAKYEFDASPLGLLPLVLVRFLLIASCAVAVALALAASPFGVVSKYVTDHGVPTKGHWSVLWGAAAALHVAVGFSGTLIRRFRMTHTSMYGQPVEVTIKPGILIMDLFITLAVMGLTAGLGLPWVYARYRRSFYRSCILPGRGNQSLGFHGSGEEVLGRFLLTLLLLPLSLATAGLMFGVITWMWVKWDYANMMVPDKHGQLHRVNFNGTFGGYFGRWALGWLLTLATAGIYRPFAKVAEWRWMAQNTVVPP